MKTFSFSEPSIIQIIDNNRIKYNYNIADNDIYITNCDDNDNDIIIQGYEFDSVILFKPLSREVLIKSVIKNTWDNDYEQKLVNDYNAALLGVFNEEETKAKIDAYTNFLIERKRIKETINNDWEIIKELI